MRKRKRKVGLASIVRDAARSYRKWPKWMKRIAYWEGQP